MLKATDDRADYERNQEEKSHANGNGKRTQPIEDERHDHTTIRFRLDVPYSIQSRLEFAKNRSRSHDKRDNSDTHRPDTLAKSARRFDHLPHCIGSLRT